MSNIKPYLASAGNLTDARLNVDETQKIVSVEYPFEESNWADMFIGSYIEDIKEYLGTHYGQFMFMKDCW